MIYDFEYVEHDKQCWGLLANNVASVCMGLKVWLVSNYTQQVPTSSNIVMVPCKRTQHVEPNNVACCWPTMLRPFAFVSMHYATSTNISQQCWLTMLWLVSSVCMDLKVMKNNINIPNSLFRLRERDTATGFPNCSRPFVVEEVTVHNTDISLLSTNVWVL